MGGKGGMLMACGYSLCGRLLQMVDLSMLNQKYVKIIRCVSASAVPHESCHTYRVPRFSK